MSKNSSAKYCKDNKKRLPKKLIKNIKAFLKKKKKKNNMVQNDTKFYQKIKNKSWLSIKKILQEKAPYYNYKKIL